MMSSHLKTHEVLLSDSYWETNGLTIPVLPLGHLLLEGFSGGFHITAFPTVNRVRTLYGQASKSGYMPEEIPHGEQLPIVPRGEGLLRVIRDIKYPAGPKDLTRSEKNAVDEDLFDEIAEEIMVNKLYSGEAAQLTVAGIEQSIRIMRRASYLTGSRTGRVLEGIDSMYIGGRNDFEHTDICHPVVVGETYATGKNRDGLSKVVKAEILVPGSPSKSKAKQKQPKLKLAPVLT